MQRNNALHVYEQPAAHHEYIVGIDSASGSAEGDYACVQVFCRHCQQQAAEWYTKAPPDETAWQAVLLARWYSGATIIPEKNNHGAATIRKLLDLGYRRILPTHPGKEVKPGTHWLEVYGFTTSTSTRPLILDHLEELIRLRSIRVYSKRFISEASSFDYNKEGRAEAKSGYHDDSIIGLALCTHADRVLPAIKPVPLSTPDDTIRSRLDQARRQALRRAKQGRRSDPHLGAF